MKKDYLNRLFNFFVRGVFSLSLLFLANIFEFLILWTVFLVCIFLYFVCKFIIVNIDSASILLGFSGNLEYKFSLLFDEFLLKYLIVLFKNRALYIIWYNTLKKDV